MMNGNSAYGTRNMDDIRGTGEPWILRAKDMPETRR